MMGCQRATNHINVHQEVASHHYFVCEIVHQVGCSCLLSRMGSAGKSEQWIQFLPYIFIEGFHRENRGGIYAHLAHWTLL